MELVEYPDRDMLMLSLARILSRHLRDAMSRRERVLFSVPGGTTPGPVFDLLSASDLDWGRIDIVPGDERWVPETSPRSNAAQIRTRLLQGPAARAHLIPLYRPLPAPSDALNELEAELTPRLPLDVALLGMGEDGHTASLFPGAAHLARALAPDAPSVLDITAPGATEPRITLTAPVLNGAFAKHVLITGTTKRAVLDQAQNGDPLNTPITALLDGASVHWAP